MLLLAVLFATLRLSAPLILPPAQKIQMGMTEDLVEECEDASDGHNFFVELDASEGAQVSRSVFERLAENGCREPLKIWFPCYENYGGELERLAAVLNGEKEALGEPRSPNPLVSIRHWPEVPSSVMEFAFTDAPFGDAYERDSPEDVAAAKSKTEEYVNGRLTLTGLCPYTKGTTKSALGLEAFGVQPGPVKIIHAAEVESCDTTTPATVAAALYWKATSELLSVGEADVATFLLVLPPVYFDFEKFCRLCDGLIEKTNMMSPGSVGRVWFHPHYKLSDVGYVSGGHAPPEEEISSLMDDYLKKRPELERPSSTDITHGMDETRWT